MSPDHSSAFFIVYIILIFAQTTLIVPDSEMFWFLSIDSLICLICFSVWSSYYVNNCWLFVIIFVWSSILSHQCACSGVLKKLSAIVCWFSINTFQHSSVVVSCPLTHPFTILWVWHLWLEVNAISCLVKWMRLQGSIKKN